MSETDLLNMVNSILSGGTTSLILKLVLLGLVGIVSVYFMWKKVHDANQNANDHTNHDQNNDQGGTTGGTQDVSNSGGNNAGNIDDIHNGPH